MYMAHARPGFLHAWMPPKDNCGRRSGKNFCVQSTAGHDGTRRLDRVPPQRPCGSFLNISREAWLSRNQPPGARAFLFYGVLTRLANGGFSPGKTVTGLANL